jgi:hypothetical protein
MLVHSLSLPRLYCGSVERTRREESIKPTPWRSFQWPVILSRGQVWTSAVILSHDSVETCQRVGNVRASVSNPNLIPTSTQRLSDWSVIPFHSQETMLTVRSHYNDP